MLIYILISEGCLENSFNHEIITGSTSKKQSYVFKHNITSVEQSSCENNEGYMDFILKFIFYIFLFRMISL